MLAEFLSIPLNAALWAPLPALRKPFFCIVATIPLDITDSAAIRLLRSHMLALGRQTYSNWTSLYFLRSSLPLKSLVKLIWEGDVSEEGEKVQFVLSAGGF
jgi:hypothetical protein